MKRLIALTVLLVAGGCQSFAPTPETAAPDNRPAESQEARETSSFSQDTLYALLVAELAGQRNRFDIALGNYVQQAHATQDPGVAERAFRIADYLGAHQAALDTAQIWARSAPDDLQAQQAVALQLARAGRFDESLDYMEKVLSSAGDTNFDFLALSAARTDPDTRRGLLEGFDRLLKRYPGNPQLIFGKALLLEQDDRTDAALALLDAQPKAERSIPSILLHARILQGHGRADEALEILESSLKRHPNDRRLRLSYARQLVDQAQFDKAIGEFASLLQETPSDDDLRLSLALVAMEAKAWREAIVYLEELIARGSHLDAAYLNLGQAHEALGETDQALEALDQVEGGNELIAAKALQTELLMKQGRDQEAAELLARARLIHADYAIQLYLLEIEMLSTQEHIEPAWALVEEALELFPEDSNLLYTRALLAEKRDDLDQLELDLRSILEREPENAMALNALGYTLADRTARLDEARTLIEQAYRLEPSDPAILDSMGWVRYRQGDNEGALLWLRKAYEQEDDAEIAAHLGEVLWAAGKQDEARQIWQPAFEQAPDNGILLETLERLTGARKP